MSVGFLGGLGHIFLTESYRYAPASVVAPFDYTSMVWALVLGYFMFGEMPTQMIIAGSAIIAASGMFVIWRERQLALRAGAPRQALGGRRYDTPNALNVMIVRVSAMPGMHCTLSAMKWPISVASST